MIAFQYWYEDISKGNGGLPSRALRPALTTLIIPHNFQARLAHKVNNSLGSAERSRASLIVRDPHTIFFPVSKKRLLLLDAWTAVHVHVRPHNPEDTRREQGISGRGGPVASEITIIATPIVEEEEGEVSDPCHLIVTKCGGHSWRAYVLSP